MKTPQKLICVRAPEALPQEIDASIGVGKPGEKGFYASRTQFVLSAVERLVEELRASDAHA